MNNQMPVTANVTIQKNLSFIDISKGKVLATDQNTHGKVLGVAKTSKTALEKVGAFGVSTSIQETAPVETAQTIQQPLPEPQVVQPTTISLEEQQPILENPVLSGAPVSVDPSVSELNTPVDVTSLPGQIVEDVKATIPEPQPLSQTINVSENIFNLEKPVNEEAQTAQQSSSSLLTLDVPAIESIHEGTPQALEPVGINEKLFEEKPVVEVPEGATTETPTEVPTEAVAEVTTETPTEVPTEVVAGIPTEAPTEAVTEVTAEAQSETSTEAPAEVATEITTSESKDVEPVDPIMPNPATPVPEEPNPTPLIPEEPDSTPLIPEEPKETESYIPIPKLEIEEEIDRAIMYVQEGSNKAIASLTQLKERIIKKEVKNEAEINSLIDEGIEKISEASSTKALTADIPLPVLGQVMTTNDLNQTPKSMGM